MSFYSLHFSGGQSHSSRITEGEVQLHSSRGEKPVFWNHPSKSFSKKASFKQDQSQVQKEGTLLGINILLNFYSGFHSEDLSHYPKALILLSEGVKKGYNLEISFQCLPSGYQRELSNIVGKENLEQIFKITKGGNRFLMASDFLSFGLRLRFSGRFIQAVPILRCLAHGGKGIPPEIQGKAKLEYEAILGVGNTGRRIEFLAVRFAEDATDYRVIVPMIFASTIYQVMRTAALARLLEPGSRGLMTRLLGPRLVSGMLGFAAEVPTFSFSSRGLRYLSGDPIGPVGLELLSVAITLGALKGSGFLGNRLFHKVHGINEFGLATQLQGITKISRSLYPQGSMFIGLMTAHKVEESIGLRQNLDGATLMTDTLSALFSLGLGSHLGLRVLGRPFVRWQQRLRIVAENLSKKAEGTKPGNGPSSLEPLLATAGVTTVSEGSAYIYSDSKGGLFNPLKPRILLSVKRRRGGRSVILPSREEIVRIDPEIFGPHVHFYRTQKGWTQKTLAEKLRVKPSYISIIEKGKIAPGQRLFRRIEEVLGFAFNPSANPELKSLGLQIRFYREQKGLIQRQLAKELGISRKDLSKIENGKQDPGENLLFQIEERLGFKFDPKAKMADFVYSKPDPKKFGSLIRTFREQKGWTQEQLAEELGITPMHVSNMETGEFPPGRDLMRRIERIFGFKYTPRGEPDLKLLGSQISYYRNKKGWSQSKLARKLRVDNSYISHLEAGRRPLSSELTQNIEEMLGFKFVHEAKLEDYIYFRPDPKELGAQIQYCRIQKGWTQKKLAKELNIAPGHLANIEVGRLVPARSLIWRAEELLGFVFDPHSRPNIRNLGSQIRFYRKQKGLLQAQLAKEVGVRARDISDLETGSRPVSRDIIRRVQEFLGFVANPKIPR